MTAAHKKLEFISQLSESFGSGGLSCSFNDKELTQYLIWKRKLSDTQEKLGILQLGKQPCGKIWVLAQDCYINSQGQPDVGHDYMWLKSFPSYGAATAKELCLEEIACDVKAIQIDPGSFSDLLNTLQSCLQHNFLSAVLLLGAGAMAFHYTKIIEMFQFCPQVMACGPPSTGKTLSLQAALSLFGANNSKNHYNSCSKPYCLRRSSLSTVPFGIDDPNLAGDISDIVISLYNGTISANISQGGIKPISCPLYCTNFTFGSNERYIVHYE